MHPGKAVAEMAKDADEEAAAAQKAAMDTKIGHDEFEHEYSEEDPCNAKQEAAFSKHGRLSCSPWPESRQWT